MPKSNKPQTKFFKPKRLPMTASCGNPKDALPATGHINTFTNKSICKLQASILFLCFSAPSPKDRRPNVQKFLINFYRLRLHIDIIKISKIWIDALFSKPWRLLEHLISLPCRAFRFRSIKNSWRRTFLQYSNLIHCIRWSFWAT